MAARLRHQLHDIAMRPGTFLIGRGAECHLALDDVLVSRRHAAIRLDDDGSATIEDLGSRNGVLLNGMRVEGAEPLNDGDLIRIGSQDICFYHTDEHDSATKPRAMRVTMQFLPAVDAQGQPIRPPDPEPPVSPRPNPRSTAPVAMRDLRPLDPDDPQEKTTIGGGTGSRAIGGLSTIGSVAEKALALGRAEEAERIIQRSLQDVLTRAAKGEVDAELAEKAATYALHLAAGTGRGQWIDFVFQLYTTLRVLAPARVVDELYAAVRKVKATDKSLIRAYTACLKQISGGFGPAERFVLQRIESFERWAP
jgi:hypothetical protein